MKRLDNDTLRNSRSLTHSQREFFRNTSTASNRWRRRVGAVLDHRRVVPDEPPTRQRALVGCCKPFNESCDIAPTVRAASTSRTSAAYYRPFV